jgi:hypothetical protein
MFAANDVASFSFNITIKHYRGGTLVETLYDQTRGADRLNDCATICATTSQSCGTTCSYEIAADGVVVIGECIKAGACTPPGGGSGNSCDCHFGQARIVEKPLVDIAIGDVFTFAVAPGTGTVDINTSNNSVSVTYQ